MDPLLHVNGEKISIALFEDYEEELYYFNALIQFLKLKIKRNLTLNILMLVVQPTRI